MVDSSKPILFGMDYKRGKVYVGYGKISAKFVKPDKKGKIKYSGKNYSLQELFENKSEDFREWH
jgi:hypothetical protein